MPSDSYYAGLSLLHLTTYFLQVESSPQEGDVNLNLRASQWADRCIVHGITSQRGKATRAAVLTPLQLNHKTCQKHYLLSHSYDVKAKTPCLAIRASCFPAWFYQRHQVPFFNLLREGNERSEVSWPWVLCRSRDKWICKSASSIKYSLLVHSSLMKTLGPYENYVSLQLIIPGMDFLQKLKHSSKVWKEKFAEELQSIQQLILVLFQFCYFSF